MADVVIAARAGEPLTWGGGADLAPVGDFGARYLEAVRAADRQDFTLLLEIRPELTSLGDTFRRGDFRAAAGSILGTNRK